VDGLLPEGVAMLAAAPKMYKSWLALDCSLSVVGGDPFLGFPTNKSEAVYFALEDSKRRVQDRLKKLTGSTAPPDGLHLVFQCEPIHQGFLQQIETVITEHKNTRLIIVDTLQKVRPPSNKDQTAYEQDYQTFGQVQELTKKYQACILFVHHTRKGADDGDPFVRILGSTALQGAADTMLVIKKAKRTDEEATLYATGRDIDSLDLVIKFNKESWRWQNLGSADALEQTRLELAYRNHPAIITLKKKLEEIQADENELTKEYVVRMKDFRRDVIECTGVTVGSSERNFSTEIGRFDPWLLKEGIEHIKPGQITKHVGQKGRFHRYKKQAL